MAVSGVGANFNQGILPIEEKGLEVTNKIVENLTVEEYVNKYFSDIPVMIEVARCESQFRQHKKNGEVLQGLVNDKDLGVMQINEHYHLEKSDKLGLDISTLEGNTAYARYLFEKKGLQPWISSSPCWKKTEAYADYRVELALNK